MCWVGIEFASRDLEKCAQETRRAIRQWGAAVGDKYVQRVATIAQAPTFDMLFKLRFLRLHPLSGERKGQFALTLHDRWRLIISKVSDKVVRIEEVTNHYGD